MPCQFSLPFSLGFPAISEQLSICLISLDKERNVLYNACSIFPQWIFFVGDFISLRGHLNNPGHYFTELSVKYMQLKIID